VNPFRSAHAASVQVAVDADSAEHRPAARELAGRLGLPLAWQVPPDSAAAPELLLVLGSEGLELRPVDRPRRRALVVDFAGPFLTALRIPGALGRLPLVRALGGALRTSEPDRTTVLDATAGLGRDAFRLAALGARVVAAERSPVLAALLEDGLRRATGDPAASGVIGDRLTLRFGDARELLARPPTPDVVLIDPMYPDEGRSALPRGEMQILRRLLGPDTDAAELLAAALAVARERVVVKRHAHDPELPGARPTRRVVGRSTRFDIYLARCAPGSL
jgi:16S rRNA (guanine1516-N2)-methyltransferase